MAAYTFDPLTWNGQTIIAGNVRTAYWEDPDPSPLTAAQSADAVEATIAGLGDRDVRGQLKATTWLLTVELSSFDQTAQTALNQLFNEAGGLVVFRCTDGGGAVWRINARVIAPPKRVSVSLFKVAIRVADPRWQEDTATTNSQLNKTASPISATLTNNGNRAARAAFTITADAAKTGTANDFGLSLQGWIVNRGPNDIINKPIALFDQGAASARLNTAGVALANGDDIRVWLDDVPDVPRWVVNPNAAGTEVWINISLPAAIVLTTTAAMTNVSPANGGSFMVNEDLTRLPAKGFLVIDNEVFYFNSRSGRTLLGIQRALWGTTAAGHSAAVPVYPNPRHYVVATNYPTIASSAYGSAPSPLSQRPAIQLVGSTNQKWKWGNQADDSNTIYFDRTNPDRTAQWVPSFDADGNTSPPAIALTASGTAVTFKDRAPGDSSPACNALEVSIPQGIGDVPMLNAVKNDWTPSPDVLNLELFLRDAGGQLQLMDQLQQSATATARALPSSPTAIPYGVKLKARYNVVTGWHVASPGNQAVTNSGTAGVYSGGTVAQSFTLDKDTWVSGVQFYVTSASAGTINVGVFASQGLASYTPGGGVPRFGENFVYGANFVSTIFPVKAVSLAAAAGLYQVTFPPRLLKAGRYLVLFWVTSPFAPTLAWESAREHPTGAALQQNITTLTYPQPMDAINGTIKFRLLCGYDASFNAVINADQPMYDENGARTGVTAGFDNTEISIASPIGVQRSGAFGTTLFHCVGTITNATTGDTIAIDKWMPTTGTLAIDCDARTVTATEAGVSFPVTKCCTFSDSADWMPLNPGANSISYADASLVAPGQMDFVSVFRGVKV